MDSFFTQQIVSLVARSKRPLLISDERIDGDSLGSSLAFLVWLQTLGKQASVYIKTAVPKQYQFMPGIDRCTTDLGVFSDPDIDLVISFDCSDEAYVRGLMARMPHLSPPPLINIDHHATNNRYGDVPLVVVGSPATAEVVYTFFKTIGWVPTKTAATCLLTGICFDTTVFSNSGTDARAFASAAALVRLGGRLSDVIRLLYRNRSFVALKAWGRALSRLKEHAGTGCTLTWLTRQDLAETGATDEDVDGLSDFLNLVSLSHTLIVMRETAEGHVKVSMRSSKYDVSAIARACGGGGHKKAAGFVLPSCRLQENEGGVWRVITST